MREIFPLTHLLFKPNGGPHHARHTQWYLNVLCIACSYRARNTTKATFFHCKELKHMHPYLPKSKTFHVKESNLRPFSYPEKE